MSHDDIELVLIDLLCGHPCQSMQSTERRQRDGGIQSAPGAAQRRAGPERQHRGSEGSGLAPVRECLIPGAQGKDGDIVKGTEAIRVLHHHPLGTAGMKMMIDGDSHGL
jgi:hypothetical protein